MGKASRRRHLTPAELAVSRGLLKGPRAQSAGLPEIAVPEPDGEPHGQMLMAGNLASNFVEYPWRGDDSIKDFARRLHEFLQSDEPYLEFLSPHDGQTHLLTRIGAASIVAINHARAKGPVHPHSDKVSIVRAGALPPELLRRTN